MKGEKERALEVRGLGKETRLILAELDTVLEKNAGRL